MLRQVSHRITPGYVLVCQSRCVSTEITPTPGSGVGGTVTPEPIRSSVNTHARRGAGGRSSFSGNVVTVFGANGMTGEAIVNRLARNGTQLIIPYRCDPYGVRRLKVPGDLGQILFFNFDLADEDSIRKTVKYSNIVINLIGNEFSTKNWSMQRTNIEGAERIARISKEMGVKKLIQVSALNADANPEGHILKNGSEFLRTKALGERAVRDAFPEAVIVRPARIYGHNDRFINLYMQAGALVRRYPPFNFLELYKRGLKTFKLPLHVNDFSSGIEKIIQDPTMNSTIVEMAGPFCYSMHELVKFMYDVCGRTDDFFYIFPLTPLAYSKFLNAEMRSKMARDHRGFTREYIENTECTSDKLTPGILQLPDIGVTDRAVFEFEAKQTLFNYLGKVQAMAGGYEERHQITYPVRSEVLMRGMVGAMKRDPKPLKGSPEYYGFT